MRPEIADLTRIIYPKLKDGENVSKYNPVKGMKHNLLFFHHSWEEQREDAGSKSNMQEAQMAVSLAKYLLQQGYKTSQITILTPYIFSP